MDALDVARALLPGAYASVPTHRCREVRREIPWLLRRPQARFIRHPAGEPAKTTHPGPGAVLGVPRP